MHMWRGTCCKLVQRAKRRRGARGSGLRGSAETALSSPTRHTRTRVRVPLGERTTQRARVLARAFVQTGARGTLPGTGGGARPEITLHAAHNTSAADRNCHSAPAATNVCSGHCTRLDLDRLALLVVLVGPVKDLLEHVKAIAEPLGHNGLDERAVAMLGLGA